MAREIKNVKVQVGIGGGSLLVEIRDFSHVGRLEVVYSNMLMRDQDWQAAASASLTVATHPEEEDYTEGTGPFLG